jgi:hypothetical protein
MVYPPAASLRLYDTDDDNTYTFLQPHRLCILNRLPPSTIHTTPHLVQTRSSLVLAPSSIDADERLPEADRKRLAHERALVRFGRATKEADGWVARAYVGLAELEADGPPCSGGPPSVGIDRGDEVAEKEKGSLARSDVNAKDSGRPPAVEDRAVGRYIDDVAWERSVGPPPPPRASSSFKAPLNRAAGRSSSSAAAASHRYPSQPCSLLEPKTPSSSPFDWALGRWSAGGRRAGGGGGFIKLG